MKIDKAHVITSDTLSHGLAKYSLRQVDEKVKRATALVTKMLARVSTSPIRTRKGAKAIGKRLTKVMSDLSLAGVTLTGSDATLFVWAVPEVIDKKLRIGSFSVIIENGLIDVQSVTAAEFSHHAFARLLQRDDDIASLEWGTIKAHLIYPLHLLWPVLLASREVGNKQFALPGANGLFIGTIDDNHVLQINTYIRPPFIPRWMMLAQAYDVLLSKLEEVAHHKQRNMDALYTAMATGIATVALKQANEVLVRYFNDEAFKWLKEPYKETDSGLIIPNDC